MTNEWIIDVLTDLKKFAQKNGMHATAAELEDTCLVALAEIASQQGNEAGQIISHEGKPGEPRQQPAESDVA